jgi:hypothetical protein
VQPSGVDILDMSERGASVFLLTVYHAKVPANYGDICMCNVCMFRLFRLPGIAQCIQLLIMY